MNAELKTEIRKLVREAAAADPASDVLPESKHVRSIAKIPGDASSRRYYRVSTDHDTYIAMKADPFKDQGDHYPFLRIQSYLSSIGVDVPQALDFLPEEGYILLEDLGDTTLLRELQEVSDVEVEASLYQRVIDELVQLQVKGKPNEPYASMDCFKLRFDHEKLMWEVGFTLEHFYEKHLSRSIKPEDRQALLSGFSDICTRLAAEPTVFTHRDFHSRNVMVVDRGGDKRFVMIDFQDARMGPAQYDLASLLRDSYYQLEESQIQHLLRYYLDRRERMEGIKIDREHFQIMFDMMSVQRNFKAIGSFASFLNRRGNATYLKYIGNTFENIRRTLLRYPRYAQLREVLFHYYYF